ncbi:hypothetical protein GMRT_12127 [Giardia muris]|uniref:Uncharacterized protein n=1 Tax=Giardia muris TaxID=5742 RepID=A0A4Z1T3E2_GIAMU|nr:hypothetical protein GMRT_12127 [Giardia muris]|eukprot:TNJ26921.1 hypothetical protein GMRT_12127 [Giardia muris]
MPGPSPTASAVSEPGPGDLDPVVYYGGLYLSAIEYVDALIAALQTRRQTAVSPSLLSEHPFPQDLDIAGRSRKDIRLWLMRIPREPALKRDTDMSRTILTHMQSVLLAILRNEEYRQVFTLRVDEEKHNAPGYYSQIPTPMHLFAIMARLCETRARVEDSDYILYCDEADFGLDGSVGNANGDSILQGGEPGEEDSPGGLTRSTLLARVPQDVFEDRDADCGELFQENPFMFYARSDYGDVLMKVEPLRMGSIDELSGNDRKALGEWMTRIGNQAVRRCTDAGRPRPYRLALEFLRDLILVPFNARRYNPPPHHIYRLAGSFLSDVKASWRREFGRVPKCFGLVGTDAAEQELYNNLLSVYSQELSAAPEVPALHTPLVPEPGHEESAKREAEPMLRATDLEMDDERRAIIEEIRDQLSYITSEKQDIHANSVIDALVQVRDSCGLSRGEDLQHVQISVLRRFAAQLSQFIGERSGCFRTSFEEFQGAQ